MSKFDCCIVVLLFPISEASIRAPRARYTTKLVRGKTSWLIPGLAESSSLVSWLFVSAPQTTSRTANTCGNILPCFAPCADRDNRTNQFLWLKLLHTPYISLSNQAEKGRVFYSYDKCFETRADPRNFCDKQILKIWTPCLSACYCAISRATFAWSLKVRVIARLSKSARARSKNYREPP